jgi:hypothetical protein
VGERYERNLIGTPAIGKRRFHAGSGNGDGYAGDDFDLDRCLFQRFQFLSSSTKNCRVRRF